jgi:hypothetical protein
MDFLPAGCVALTLLGCAGWIFTVIRTTTHE